MASKPTLLCLHGGGSNNDITPFQTGGLKLQDRFECIYLHAPHVARQCYPGLENFSDGPFYTWSDTSKSLEDQEDQWEDSLVYIAEYCKRKGPFAGVYGFSQGAAIITNFSHPTIWRDKFKMSVCPWKFAILGCAGASHRLSISKGVTINMPSFHILGLKDRHLNDSRTISQFWDKSQKATFTHDRGHEIDMQMWKREKELMERLNEFLNVCAPTNKGIIGSIR